MCETAERVLGMDWMTYEVSVKDTAPVRSKQGVRTVNIDHGDFGHGVGDHAAGRRDTDQAVDPQRPAARADVRG